MTADQARALQKSSIELNSNFLEIINTRIEHSCRCGLSFMHQSIDKGIDSSFIICQLRLLGFYVKFSPNTDSTICLYISWSDQFLNQKS